MKRWAASAFFFALEKNASCYESGSDQDGDGEDDCTDNCPATSNPGGQTADSGLFEYPGRQVKNRRGAIDKCDNGQNL